MLSGIQSLRKWKASLFTTSYSLVLLTASVFCRIYFLYSKDDFFNGDLFLLSIFPGHIELDSGEM